MVEVTDEELE